MAPGRDRHGSEGGLFRRPLRAARRYDPERQRTGREERRRAQEAHRRHREQRQHRPRGHGVHRSVPLTRCPRDAMPAELFASLAPTPLAERMRPKSWAEILGQDHLLGPEGPLGRMLAARKLNSLILWGPPGCGKTTIARLLAEATDLHFEPLSAVFSGVGDLRRIFEAARQRRKDGKGTLLFVDEIHRFNRAQQDGFLPYVEDGTVTLIGATTENPSFELNAALLSRCQVLVLRRLDDAALETLIQRAETHYGEKLKLTGDARASLRAMADGDGRYLLNLAEELAAIKTVEP